MTLWGNLNVLGKKLKNTKPFLFQYKKVVTNIDKDGNESIEIISYKIKFINSAKFMASLSSNLVDNLVEEIHKIKSKDCDCFLEDESAKDDLIKYKCLSCNKDYLNKLNEELKRNSRTHLSLLTMIQ